MKQKLTHFFRHILFMTRMVLSPLLLTLCSALMLLVAIFTLFRQRRFYAEYIAAPFGRLMLFIWGIKIEVHGKEAYNRAIQQQVIYISNHTSTIDIFALIALGLPNTRFFLNGFLRKILPLGLIGYLIGNFWTVPQEQPEQRVAIFKTASDELRLTGESVYLSPEGERVTTGKIGHFNKGAFHLATALSVPIVPMYLSIPPQINPGTGFNAGAGTVSIYFGDAIDTSDWQLNELNENKEKVRDLFVNWQQQLIMHNNEADMNAS